MTYVVYFSDRGTPKTGLSPTLDVFVKISDGASAGTPPSVSELSGGFYKFTYSPTEDVAIRVDSEDATMLDADRYVAMVVSPLDVRLESFTEGNIYREFVAATSQDLSRNVEVGKLDHMNLKGKLDADPDWTTPVWEKVLYARYQTLGDDNPVSMREA